MNHHDTRHIISDRRRDPQAYAADDHQRATEAAEDTLWHIVHDGDLKIQALTEGLQAIKKHMEIIGAKTGTAWNIADVALNKAEAIGK